MRLKVVGVSNSRFLPFDVADLTSVELPPADFVIANLTGALLVRSAPRLLGAVVRGGALIVGGLLAHERADVVAACRPALLVWEREEDGWVGLTFRHSGTSQLSAAWVAETTGGRPF